MYFITTKRMLEVCFSAHPNIQYRAPFFWFMEKHQEGSFLIIKDQIPCNSNGGVYSSFALLFSCIKPCVSPSSIAASTTFWYS